MGKLLDRAESNVLGFWKPKSRKPILSIIGPGMEICPNCGKELREFVYDPLIEHPDSVFTNLSVWYTCKCGYKMHCQMDRDPEWVAKAYRPPLDLSKHL